MGSRKFVKDICKIVGHDYIDPTGYSCSRCGYNELAAFFKKKLSRHKNKVLNKKTLSAIASAVQDDLRKAVDDTLIGGFNKINVVQTGKNEIKIEVEIMPAAQLKLIKVTTSFTL